MKKSLVAGLGAWTFVVFVGLPALGFCRTTTCDATRRACAVDQSRQCIIEGAPLIWPGKCVSFTIQKDGSPKHHIDYDLASQTISQGFLQWLSADCGGGATPSIQISDFGAVSCDKQEYNQKNPNANIWLFRDEVWPYEGTNATLALTTITFNVENGEIYDADVEINAFDKNLTVGAEPVVADLASIVTHEAGHFLGLAHSNRTDATMFAAYNQGQIGLRTLSADDVEGICTIYPPERSAPSGTCEPRHGFSTRCAEPVEDKGCSMTSSRPPTGSSGGTLLAVGLVGLTLLRRSRSRAADSS